MHYVSVTKVAKEYEGRKVGPYELTSLVGEGGMGAVFRARDSRTGEEYALKFIVRRKQHSDDAMTLARRLRDEASATKSVKSPHLARFVSSGEDEELGPYVVYEFLQGGSLRSFLDEKGPLGVEATLSCVARPLLLALESLHDVGIIHRDVKPDNLLNRGDGHFKLGDLGLAHFEGRKARTRTGVIVGTPGYVAPEMLLDGNWIPTASADCYAAALCIIEAMTGKYPFKGVGAALVREQLTSEPTCGDLVRLGLERPLANVLAGALIRDPKYRSSSAKELLDDLEKVILHPLRNQKTGLSKVAQALKLEEVTTKTSPAYRRYLPWFFLLFVFLAMCANEFTHRFENPLPESHGAIWSNYARALEKMRAGVPFPSGESYWHFCLAADELKEAGKTLMPWKELVATTSEGALERRLLEAEQLRFDGKELKGLQKLEEGLTLSLKTLAEDNRIREKDLAFLCVLLFRFNMSSAATSSWREKSLQKVRKGMLKVVPEVARSPGATDYRAFYLMLWANLFHQGKLGEQLSEMEPALSTLALRKECSPLVSGLIRSIWQDLGRKGEGPPVLDRVSYEKHMEGLYHLAVMSKTEAIQTLYAYQRKVNEVTLFVGKELRQKVGRRNYLHLFRRGFWQGWVSELKSKVGLEHHSQVHLLSTMIEISTKEMWSPFYASLAKDGQNWGIGFAHEDIMEWLLQVAVAGKNEYLLARGKPEMWSKACFFFDVAHPCLGFKGAWATNYHNRALELLVPPGQETEPPCALLLSVGLWAKGKKASSVIVLERVLEERKKRLVKIFSRAEKPPSLLGEMKFTMRSAWELLRRMYRLEDLSARLRGMKSVEETISILRKDWPETEYCRWFLESLLFINHADIAIRAGKDKAKIREYMEEAKRRYLAVDRKKLYINIDYFLQLISKGEKLGF